MLDLLLLLSYYDHYFIVYKVEPMMFQLLYGEISQEPAAYIDLIMEEVVIRDYPSVLAQDCVLIAVEEGKYLY